MFKRHYQKRSPNILFVMFRLVLSGVMFVVLLAGTYTAYKHFSGLDPLKLDPQAILNNFLQVKTPQQFLSVLSSIKLTTGLSSQVSQKVLAPIVVSGGFKFVLVADSHNDNGNLRKALTQAKQNFQDLKFIVGLGDYTDVGTLDELKKAKDELDLTGLRYFLIPGDHDLWDGRDKGLSPIANFNQTFGPTYQSFIFNQFKFILINNADNYIGIDNNQQNWISEELEKSKEEATKGIFVFIHEPIYHPSSEHTMGSVEAKLKLQAKSLIYQLKAAGIKKLFAGDIHYFSEYEEPETKLSMVTVGAAGLERNPQVPRFAVVTIFEDGSSRVEDVEIK